jgi:hypothetical protein
MQGNITTPDKKELLTMAKLELARRDPKVFVFEYCFTRFRKKVLREGSKTKEVVELTDVDFVFENCTERIPRHPYIEQVIDNLQQYNQLAIPKSRQIMITWVVLAYCLWYALKNEGANIYLQKEKESESGFGDPIDSLGSRIMFIYEHLPEELRDPLFKTPKMSPPTIYFPTKGSAIMGLAAGPDQLRGKDASIVVIDEASFQRFLRDTLTTLMPIVQSGAQAVLISTANGKDSFYDTVSDGGKFC